MENAQVELKIPCQAEFIGVARLVILGVASRTSLSYDEVEDLRLAVGEACTSAIERAESAGKPDSQITIACDATEDRFTIEVSDSLPQTANGSAKAALAESALSDEQSIGALLMEILVDELETESDPEKGTRIKMAKYFGRS